MAHSNKPKTSFLPPELAIEIAWARTTQLSSNQAVRIDAERAKKQMDDIKKSAENTKDKKEMQYVNGVYSAIESTFRNLVTARNALDLNFTEMLKLRDKQKENIRYVETFSSELQSFIPRISEMTIGGVSGGVLFGTILENWFPPSLKPYAMPLVLAFGAAIGYILHGVVVVPVVRKRLQKEVIRMDYDSIRYFTRYVERVRASLKNLFNRVDRLHKNIFGVYYYDEEEDPNEFVNNVLVGMEPSMCEHVAVHIDKIITPDLWSMCKTGQDIENCKYYPRRRI